MISAQVDFELQTVALLSEARRLAKRLEDERDELADDDEARRAMIEAALEQLVTAEGTYMRPMLIDQASYLYNMVKNADQDPGGEARDRYEVLSAEFAGIRSSVGD